MTRYTKAAVAVLGALVIALKAALFGDNHVSPEEAIQIIVAAVTAFQVWLTANVPSARYAKAITAVVLAVAAGLLANLSGGVDGAETIALVIAALTAGGVFAVPNDGVRTVRPVDSDGPID